MAVRRLLASALVTLAAVPAHAQDAATVVSERESALSAIAGACGYTAVLTGPDRYYIQFGGIVTASAEGSVWLTSVKCTISDGAGRTESTESTGVANVGFTLTRATQWRGLPAQVCVEGFAAYAMPGEHDQRIYLDQMCETRLGT